MLLVVGMVLLAMSVIERRSRTARARTVSALADQIDFAFSTVDSYGLVDLPFSLFLQSGSGTAKLVISGTHNGLSEAWIAIIPTPTSATLLSLTLLASSRRRRN